jgi:hypothetical protein
MKDMTSVFTVSAPAHEAHANAPPRVFVHQLDEKHQQLVEVDDPDELTEPWLQEDDDDDDSATLPESPQRKRGRAKVYQCNICRKWFDRPSALATHQTAHTGKQRM